MEHTQYILNIVHRKNIWNLKTLITFDDVIYNDYSLDCDPAMLITFSLP